MQRSWIKWGIRSAIVYSASDIFFQIAYPTLGAIKLFELLINPIIPVYSAAYPLHWDWIGLEVYLPSTLAGRVAVWLIFDVVIGFAIGSILAVTLNSRKSSSV